MDLCDRRDGGLVSATYGSQYHLNINSTHPSYNQTFTCYLQVHVNSGNHSETQYLLHVQQLNLPRQENGTCIDYIQFGAYGEKLCNTSAGQVTFGTTSLQRVLVILHKTQSWNVEFTTKIKITGTFDIVCINLHNTSISNILAT